MSVCGVECGQLSIEGTSADDKIAVRYDSGAGLVRVLAGEGELLGQFTAADLRSLYINGSSGNDRFELDSNLPFNLRLNGGDGEDSLLSAEHVGGQAHEHGSAVIFDVERFLPASTVSASPSVAPVPSSGAVPIVNALLLDPAAGSQISSTLALASVVPLAGHGAHSLTAQALGSVVQADHHSPVNGELNSSSVASNHHYRSLASSAATHVSATNSVPVAVVGDSEVAQTVGAHPRHTSQTLTAEVSAKVTPKRCTTTYVARELNRSIYGTRQCDCKAKQAAKEAAEQGRIEKSSDASSASKVAGTTCLPCQANGFWPGAGSQIEMCVDGVQTIVDAPLPAVVSTLETKRLRTASRLSQHEAGDDSWATGFQIAGYSLIAAGAALVPFLWEPRRKNSRVIDEIMALQLDWSVEGHRCRYAA